MEEATRRKLASGNRLDWRFLFSTHHPRKKLEEHFRRKVSRSTDRDLAVDGTDEEVDDDDVDL